MIAYHIGANLSPGDELIPNYKDTNKLIKPFITALGKSIKQFDDFMLQARYLREVMRKSRLREWSNCCKWGTEAIFEYVRVNGYENKYSRIKSNYYYASTNQCEELFKIDYCDPGDDDGSMAIYEIEIMDENIQRYDMRIYNEAYDAMENEEPILSIIEIAKRYWNNEINNNGIIELISDKKAIVKSKIRWSWE